MSSQPVYIFVAGEPRGKGRPRFVRSTGHAYTPQQTASYEAVLRFAAQQAMDGREMFLGPVRVTVAAQFAIPKSFTKTARSEALAGRKLPVKRSDADNILKIAADSMNQIVFRDDAQITDAVVSKRYALNPGLAIEVRAA